MKGQDHKPLCFAAILCASALIVTAAVLYGKSGVAWWLLMLFVGVALLLAAVYGLRKKDAPESSSQYVRRQTFVTPAEREFLKTLRAIVGTRYEVCPQVPLTSVIEKRGAAFHSELFRVADYLIADAETFAPILLIELNDTSHNLAERAARDEKVQSVCAAAKMPLVAFTTAEAQDVAFVRKTLKRYLR